MPVIQRSPEEREALINQYLPQCARLANAWGFNQEQREELRAELYMNLVEAIDRTPTAVLSPAFVTLVSKNHRASLLQRVRAGFRIPPKLLGSMDAPAPGEEHKRHPQTLHDVIGDPNAVDPEKTVIEKEEIAIVKQIVDAAMSKLTPNQRTVLCYYIGWDNDQPMPMTEIARNLGHGTVWCFGQLKQAKAMLRDELNSLSHKTSAAPVLSKEARQKVMAKLSPIQRTIIERHFGLGPDKSVPITTIAPEIGRSRGNTYKQFTAARSILRSELTKRGFGYLSGEDLKEVLRGAA